MHRSFISLFIACGILLSPSSILAADEALPMETENEVAPAVSEEGNHIHDRINWDQRKAMFLRGVIPISNQEGKLLGHLEVNYLPGAQNIMKDGKELLAKALESLKPYVEKEEFWQEGIWGTVRDAMTLAWKENQRHGLGRVPSDYTEFKEKFNSVKVSEFGGLGTKCLATAKFGAQCAGRSLTSLASLSAGITFSVIAPVIILLWPASKFMIQGTYGLAKPSVKMVWQAGAWTVTQFYSKTPPMADTATLTWVPVKTGP